eukprot:TRINITY_DN18518_c0_g1_i4.p1 TRINITY_DN18518_c0_g1~~TRINITY_DN18518_c0_g1_i4.p1  ORF type:complete len:1152 (+),score=251.40 TRINITY_DN18518_c0_g1_i4:48-3458(+)
MQGALCFAPSARDGWLLAQVVGHDRGAVLWRAVASPDEGASPPSALVPTTAAATAEPDDLSELPDHHEAPVLEALRRRYKRQTYFTDIGLSIVVWLNPFHRLPAEAALGSRIAAMARRVWSRAVSDLEPHCVIVSGDTGSGKTEAVQEFIRGLAAAGAAVGSPQQRAVAAAGLRRAVLLDAALDPWIKARTSSGRNVGRGTRLTVAHFDAGALCGAEVSLRLVDWSCAAPAGAASAFNALQLSRVQGTGTPHVNPAVREEVSAAWLELGVRAEVLEAAWAAAAATDALGSCSFSPDGSVVRSAELGEAASRLCVSPDALAQVLITGVDGCAALRRSLYAAAVSALLVDANAASRRGTTTVDIADVCGVDEECVHGLDALGAHLAAEATHHHFAHTNLQGASASCADEGVVAPRISGSDNSACLKTLAGQRGVLDLLDYESNAVGGSDARFVATTLATHSGSPWVAAAADGLAVRHFRSVCTYRTDGWCATNVGTGATALRAVLSTSMRPAIAALVAAIPAPMARSKRIREELLGLMGTLSAASPVWIRCVDPSGSDGKEDWAKASVQLAAAGTSSAATACRLIPVRTPLATFIGRYRALVGAAQSPAAAASSAEAVLMAARQPADVRAGRSSVFAGAKSIDALDQLRLQALAPAADTVRAFCLGHVARVRLREQIALSQADAVRTAQELVALRRRIRRQLSALPAEEEEKRRVISRQHFEAACSLVDCGATEMISARMAECQSAEEPLRRRVEFEEENTRAEQLELRHRLTTHSLGSLESSLRRQISREEQDEFLAAARCAVAEYFDSRMAEEQVAQMMQREGVEGYAEHAGALLLWHALEEQLMFLIGVRAGGAHCEPRGRLSVEAAERDAWRVVASGMAGVFAIQRAAELEVEERLHRSGHAGVGGIEFIEREARAAITAQRIPAELEFITAARRANPGAEQRARSTIELEEEQCRRELRLLCTIAGVPHRIRHLFNGPQTRERVRLTVQETEGRRALHAAWWKARAELLTRDSRCPSCEAAQRRVMEKLRRDCVRALRVEFAALRATWSESVIRVLMRGILGVQHREILHRALVAADAVHWRGQAFRAASAAVPAMAARAAERAAARHGAELREAEYQQRWRAALLRARSPPM